MSDLCRVRVGGNQLIDLRLTESVLTCGHAAIVRPLPGLRMSLCHLWHRTDAASVARFVPPALTPVERMSRSVPVGGGIPFRLADVEPGFEASAFEGQRTQDLPPRLGQVWIGSTLGQEGELPMRIAQSKQQRVSGAMSRVASTPSLPHSPPTPPPHTSAASPASSTRPRPATGPAASRSARRASPRRGAGHMHLVRNAGRFFPTKCITGSTRLRVLRSPRIRIVARRRLTTER